jgi:cystathionine gamma-synthase
MLWGQTPDPFACWLLERGLKTLDVRVQRANESAMRIASGRRSARRSCKVHYPGLPTHPDHAVAKATLDGYGGMLASSSRAAAAPPTASFAPQARHSCAELGGVDTLVSEPRYTSHAKMTAAERAAIGIPDGFLRLSIGLEAADDLIADLEQALK